MNLVIIAGIKRSFSTGQYNLVRLALEMAGYNVIIRGHRFNIKELGGLGEKDVILLKRHPFHEAYAKLADQIFLTDRPDEEIIESLTKFNGIRPGQSHIDNMRKHLGKWKEYDHLMLDFDIWQMDEFMYIHSILNYLGYDIYKKSSPIAILEAFNEIEPPESGQDSKTLLFSNHISNYDE